MFLISVLIRSSSPRRLFSPDVGLLALDKSPFGDQVIDMYGFNLWSSYC